MGCFRFAGYTSAFQKRTVKVRAARVSWVDAGRPVTGATLALPAGWTLVSVALGAVQASRQEGSTAAQPSAGQMAADGQRFTASE